MKSETSDVMQNSELLYKHITRICILVYFSDNPCAHVLHIAFGALNFGPFRMNSQFGLYSHKGFVKHFYAM